MTTKIIPRTKRWPGNNLGHLIDLIYRLYPGGVTLSELSKRTGMSVRNLSAILCKDNTHLSTVEGIARSLGYVLHIDYYYAGEYPSDSTFNPSQCSGNLYGLEEYCQRLNRSVNYVAGVCGVKRDVVASALAKGDIMVETLIMIAAAIGLTLSWKYVKDTQNE